MTSIQTFKYSLNLPSFCAEVMFHMLMVHDILINPHQKQRFSGRNYHLLSPHDTELRLSNCLILNNINHLIKLIIFII